MSAEQSITAASPSPRRGSTGRGQALTAVPKDVVGIRSVITPARMGLEELELPTERSKRQSPARIHRVARIVLTGAGLSVLAGLSATLVTVALTRI